jgi:hypothetical protein
MIVVQGMVHVSTAGIGPFGGFLHPGHLDGRRNTLLNSKKEAKEDSA